MRDASERFSRMERALELVGLSMAEYGNRYPHELSGGQRQRIAIARAIVLDPTFIVADEPVSMLDVSVQAGVLSLIQQLAQELGLGVLYISHDIATVRYICDRVAVMYLGLPVELGGTEDVLSNPKHPYTERLISAVPSVDPYQDRERVELPGAVPIPINVPSGCRFHTRCAFAMDVCAGITPEWREVEPGHLVACHLFERTA